MFQFGPFTIQQEERRGKRPRLWLRCAHYTTLSVTHHLHHCFEHVTAEQLVKPQAPVHHDTVNVRKGQVRTRGGGGVVGEKGWEVSPPPDGSPLLANWQNHLPWHSRGHLHDGPAEEARQCHRVKYGEGSGKKARQDGGVDLCCQPCFGSFRHRCRGKEEEGRRWK